MICSFLLVVNKSLTKNMQDFNPFLIWKGKNIKVVAFSTTSQCFINYLFSFYLFVCDFYFSLTYIPIHQLQMVQKLWPYLNVHKIRKPTIITLGLNKNYKNNLISNVRNTSITFCEFKPLQHIVYQRMYLNFHMCIN